MKHSDTKRVVLTLRDILRDKLRIVNSRKSALCSLGHAAWHQTATTRPLTSAIQPCGRDPRGGKVYWCVASSDPRFRSASVKAEVKGSCARVAQTPLVPEQPGRSPTSASGGPLLRLLVPGV